MGVNVCAVFLVGSIMTSSLLSLSSIIVVVVPVTFVVNDDDDDVVAVVLGTLAFVRSFIHDNYN